MKKLAKSEMKNVTGGLRGCIALSYYTKSIGHNIILKDRVTAHTDYFMLKVNNHNYVYGN